MKRIATLLSLLLFTDNTYGMDMLSGLGSTLGGFLKNEKPGLTLESVAFQVFDETNSGAAVEVHLVIIYDDRLAEKIREMTAYEYFRQEHYDKISKNYPGKVKIFKWTLPAKSTISDWKKIPYPNIDLVPILGRIFAKYSNDSSGSSAHDKCSITIEASTKKLEIILKKDSIELKPGEQKNQPQELTITPDKVKSKLKMESMFK